MAELRFLGLSQDGTQLLLADSRGRKHTVGVDARLMAAMRLDGPPTGQREIALNSNFSPRDVQARLRAGATVADLADEYGVAVEKVERFSGPPMADRAFAADQARQTIISSAYGERSLDTVVNIALESEGTERVQWDSWLREDGRWQVLASYPIGALDQVATWIFDPHERTVIADDDTAAELTSGPRPVTSISVVVDEEPAAVEEPRETSTVQEIPSGDAAPSAAARPAKRGRRASVPTWDEILFGSNTAGDESD